MSKSLLAFDTDRIKSYVFATGKLKEIRGGSAILDELNRMRMRQIIENDFGGRTIYANGGSGLFILDSNDQAEAAKAAVEKRYRQETRTASITGVSVELPSDYKEGDDIQPYFQTLGYRLRAAKDSKAGPGALVTHPYLHFCASCGTEYAEEKYTASEETELLCAGCKKKREKDIEIKTSIHQIVNDVTAHRAVPKSGLWTTLIPTLSERGYKHLEGYDRPEDFSDLAEVSHPKNYIGLIYADGDSMGKELERLQSEADFKNFSKAVDSSIYEAVAQAITEHLQPDISQAAWPFDILMLGGDDLVMVTPADKVLDVGLTVMEQFSRLTSEKLNRDQGLNLSVGIAIAHANYPFGQLLSLAESVLKFAKKEGAKRRQNGQQWDGGLLNFVVVSSANHLNFGEYFDADLTGYAEPNDKHDANPKNLHRTLRPYNANEFRKLLNFARSESIVKAPRSKLQHLRHALFKSKNQAMVDGLTTLFHWRSKRQREAIQEVVMAFTPQDENGRPEHGMLFPWYQTGPKEEPKYYTPLLDLIEILNFVSLPEREKFDE